MVTTADHHYSPGRLEVVAPEDFKKPNRVVQLKLTLEPQQKPSAVEDAQ